MKNTNAHTSRFDIAICNPPYCRKLHLEILDELVLHCDEIVNISPSDWLTNKTSRFRKKSKINTFKNLAIKIDDVLVMSREQMNKDFGMLAWTDLAISKFNNKASFDLDSLIIKDFFYEKVILKVLRMDAVFNHFIEGYRNFDTPYVTLPVFRGNVGNEKECSEWICPKREFAFSRNGGIRKATINFKTEEEAENFFLSLQTKFMRFLRTRLDSSMGISWNYCPYMKDYTQPWTDERFCDYFGITDEEKKVIEETINKIDNKDLQKERVVSE